jgi:hypothetical protein
VIAVPFSACRFRELSRQRGAMDDGKVDVGIGDSND